MGVGAVQANMAIFGAEQLREEKPITKYFLKYYMAVNIGCFLALSIVAYIQQDKSYFIGYLISTIFLVLTAILFCAGYKCYNHIKPHDSVISKIFPVLISACRTRLIRLYDAHKRTSKKKPSIPSIEESTDEDGRDNISASDTSEQQITFLDNAKMPNNGQFLDRIVNDIKSLRRIIVLFLLLIPYWLIYLQVRTCFVI